jgi:hypothetical protein
MNRIIFVSTIAVLLTTLSPTGNVPPAAAQDGQALERLLESLSVLGRESGSPEHWNEWLEQEKARLSEELSAADADVESLRRRIAALKTGETLIGRDSPRAPSGEEVPIPSEIDFNRDVRPILAANCFACHGQDANTRKAGLRLDIGEEATVKAIVPGDPEASPALQRILTDEEADRMPPASTGKTLKPREIEILKRWIASGADYQPHWAFIPPKKRDLPGVSNAGWPRNPIDHFVLARLDREGLTPSPEADRYTLLRRLHLDLTGIPPTVEEIEAFASDEAPDAYEKAVDRLLESPHFGERWAQMWLDLARYADTQGYEKDNSRTIWRYRDWVIDAFNRDLPFDEFTIEQIAGDLLPNPSTDQILATAFHRNTMTNTEGGTDDEEFRNAAVVDRVNTTMEVWMGLTMACAQCHSHKYDPISQTEYFQFFALLNQTADSDKDNEAPTALTPTQEQQALLDEVDYQIELSEQILQTSEKKLLGRQGDWEPQARSLHADRPKVGTWHTVGPFIEEDFALANGAAFDTSFSPEQRVDITETFRGETLAWKEQPGWRDGEIVHLPGTQCATYLYRTLDCATDTTLHLSLGSADGIKVFFNSEQVFAKNEDREIVPGSDRVEIQARQGKNHLLLKVAHTNGAHGFVFAIEEPTVPEEAWLALNSPAGERSEKRAAALKDFYLQDTPEYPKGQALLEQLRNDRSQLAQGFPTTPILSELPEDRRRETRIQLRGNFLDLGDPVQAGVPAAFSALPESAPLNRLGLAQWLVGDKNPLTARVFVNRVWERLFGIGIVETTEDFGTQGELPFHPELLDWLAVEFREQGWSIKQLIRLMATSAAYRQSSLTTGELEEADPYNRLLARGPRFRLPAELIRDQALAVSGLLSEKIGGPSVMPPQPEGVWQVVYSGEEWITPQGEDRYRRGLYTFWRRTSPYPSMVTFDAPSREVCTSRRIRTNTPLQALVTLNDPVYVEAAQALARRMVEQCGPDNAPSGIDYGFLRTVGRPASEGEVSRLVELYESELEHFRASPEDAEAMASDPVGPVPEGMDAAQLAALSVVANVLFNLDEVLMKP